MRVLVLTLGSPEHGMGHVSRQCVLAAALEACGVTVDFATDRNTPGYDWLARTGRTVVHDESWLLLLSGPMLAHVAPHYGAVIVDIEHGPSRWELDLLRAYFPRVIVVAGNGYGLQDYDAVRDLADLEIYQGLDDLSGRKVIAGVEHIIIDSRYKDGHPNACGHIVLNWGGSDPHCLTEPSLAALAGIDRRVVVVVGPARAPLTGHYPGVEIVNAPPNLLAVLDGAALFVGAFGTVVWEALSGGIVAVMLGWSSDHVTTQAKLQALGVGRNLGRWDEFDPKVFRICVESFICEQKLLPKYYRRARELVDGQGARRCAERIVACLR